MLRRFTFAVAIIALYCGATFTTNGCGGSSYHPPPRPMPSSVTELLGKVTDAESGKPVEGVKISVQGQMATTNADGEYFFSGLDPRRCVLTAAREGYLVHELPVVLEPGVANHFDFPLRRR